MAGKSTKETVVEDKPTQPEVEKTPQEQLTEALAEVESLTQDLQKAQTEAEKQRQGASKKGIEVQKLQGQLADITSLRTTLEIHTHMLADLIDGSSDDGEKPDKRRSEDYLKNLKDSKDETLKATQETARQQHQVVIDEVMRQVQSVGLDTSALDSDEFMKAKLMFLEGKSEDGLEEVKRIVKSKAGEKQETPEEMKERIRKEILIERGELEAEIGQPGSAAHVYTREQIGKMSPEQYEKDRDKIWEAYSKGQVK